jgi:hypothetical protein
MQDTWGQLDRLNIMDMSAMGMSSNNSPLATKTDMIRQAEKGKITQFQPKPKKIKGPLDDLNNWMHCDPEKPKDVLPQPFRFIDELIEETLMFKVNKKIDEINDLKANPSYEGHINKTAPSGAYELDGITCFSQEENILGYVLAGDNNGYVYLLDIANKARLGKFDTKERKCVLELKMIDMKYGEKHAILFFVIYLGKFEVDCFLIFSHDHITMKKVFSFGKDIKQVTELVSDKDKKVPPTAASKKLGDKDPKKVEEEVEIKKEYLDKYPFVEEINSRKLMSHQVSTILLLLRSMEITLSMRFLIYLL